MTPALSLKLGYHEVTGAYYGPRGVREIKTARMGGRDVFSCAVDLFDVEKDIFPYDDASFDLVLACEIIEHLERDPMHMLREINRVLDHRGTVVLTTPNCASISSIEKALFGYENPQGVCLLPAPGALGTERYPRARVHAHGAFQCY